MLTSIRTAASNWLGRLVLTVIMGLLIISFAVWGIGDIFRGKTNQSVASIGDVTIGAEEFRTAFNEELRRLQQRARRAVTTEDARTFGLDRELLGRMVNDAALNQKAKAFGLAVDDTTVAQGILNADVFKVAGQFDRNRYLELLQQNGLTEAVFLRQQGELMLRQQIINGLVGGFQSPEIFGAAVHQYRSEARNLDLVIIPAEKAVAPPAPDEASLKAYFEEHRSEFRSAETRKATILATSPVQFAGNITLTEQDIRAFYDKGLSEGRFGMPEKRRAFRILFESEAEAKAAAETLRTGTIEALLAEKKLAESDVDLGLKTRLEITDTALREAIFSLKPGEVSAPVKDDFGFVLIKLISVEPAKATPFESVKAQIEGEARLDKIARDPEIRARLDAQFRAIEDQRLAGKSLAEAAASAGLTPVLISSLDQQGRDEAGKPLSIAGGEVTIGAIFASDIGLDNEPLQQRDGGHIWFEVNGIEPAREKAFDEVKAEVEVRFITEAKAKALSELATSLIKRMDEGATLAAIATDLAAPVQNLSGITRASRDAILGQNGVERAFAGPIGKAVSALSEDGIGRILIVPKATSLLPYDAKADIASGFARQISQAMAEDMVAQYVAAIKKELKANINQAAVAQALGQTN